MLESIERLRKDADMCTQMAGVENKFETVWITKDALLKDIDAIEREVEERYIEGPVDADGMTISPLDNMVDSNGKPFTVSSIELLDSGAWLVYGIGKLGNAFAKLCHHHKPPTVEDLLWEFAYCCEEGATDKSLDEIVAEYAPKLQLREVE